jgi:hypothetical protein
MLWPCGPGSSRGPQWCSNEATTQRCGLTGENLVAPVCWTSLSAAQLARPCLGPQGAGLLPEGNRSATLARPPSWALMTVWIVPGCGLGGCLLDKVGMLAASDTRSRARCPRRGPRLARDRGGPGRSRCRTARRCRCCPGGAPSGPELRSSAARRPARHRRCRCLSSRSGPGLQEVTGRRQSAASQSASRSITRSRIRGDGGISGLGGCKIGSLPGLVRAGNAGPRSP